MYSESWLCARERERERVSERERLASVKCFQIDYSVNSGVNSYQSKEYLINVLLSLETFPMLPYSWGFSHFLLIKSTILSANSLYSTFASSLNVYTMLSSPSQECHSSISEYTGSSDINPMASSLDIHSSTSSSLSSFGFGVYSRILSAKPSPHSYMVE